jgi:adenylate kinase
MKLIIFGAPGSGKGTQAKLISEYFNLKRICLGDILRQEVKGASDLGQQVKGYMEKGLLVPDELIIQVVEEHIEAKGFILDGYPRNLNQSQALDNILKKHNVGIDAFIYLDVDEATIVDRLSKRRVCKNCHANYHLENMPPAKEGVCDSCGQELVQRKDDNPDTITKRWQVFIGESQKILDFYQAKGKLIKVNGQLNKDDIFEEIKNVCNNAKALD